MATLGLVPAAMSHAIGSETQRPIAVVVVLVAVTVPGVAATCSNCSTSNSGLRGLMLCEGFVAELLIL